ncbi:histidine kinase [Leptospira perolatii]|uniref:histidine kinase n=1 Tax=Leptospira perolatii TaxID=2023191 RepID=A0A2M9ZQL8_9LEPT|nr:PAS domain S-box protein [Leptospira perolatii]PJZ70542.1 histidine kinase [Leptospira perolatii]PJZ74378.1 histidine kinase [Leptospira perolatii]
MNIGRIGGWFRERLLSSKRKNELNFAEQEFELFHSIALRSKNQIALRDQLENIQTLLGATEDWVLLLDKSGKIQFINASGKQEIYRRFGIQLSPGAKFWEAILKEQREVFQTLFQQAVSGRKVKWHFTKLFPTEEQLELEASFVSLKKTGHISQIALFLRDVTVRTIWANALLSSEEKYRRLVEVCPDGIGLHSEGKLAYLNQAGLKILGYTELGEVEGKSIMDFIHPEFRASVLERVSRALSSDRALETAEEKLLSKDGNTILAEVTGVAFENSGKKVMQVMFRDISERKKSEQELSELRKKLVSANDRLRGIIEGARDAICAVDMDMRIIACNTAFEILVWKLYGKKISVGDRISDAAIHNQNERKMIIENWSRALRGEVFRLERRVSGIVTSDSVFEINYSSIRDQNHNLIGAAQIIRDVTDRYNYEETLRISLNEKEVMLKEIHHRVKNNLQVISSLLSLQTEFTDDPKLISVLKECERRILSMALVHKELYQNDSISDADFREYLNNLLVALIQSFGASRKVSYRIYSDEIKLHLDHAIPLALVLNELVSNSLKYAFPGEKTGKIEIQIERLDGKLVLNVSDDGVGFPKGFDIFHSESLGLQLVGMLLGKLKANWRLEPSKSGVSIQIEVPLPRA